MDEIEEVKLPVEPSKLSKHQREAGRLGGRSRSEAKRLAVRANIAKARLSRWKGREAAAIASANAALAQVSGGLANLHDNPDIALDRTLEHIARTEGVLHDGSEAAKTQHKWPMGHLEAPVHIRAAISDEQEAPGTPGESGEE